MSTLSVDTIAAKTGNGDLELTGDGTGTVNLPTGFKVNNVANSFLSSATNVTVAQGGTGASTFADNGVLFGNGTSAIGATAVGTATQVLTSNGSGSAPTFQDAAAGGAWNLIGTVVADDDATLTITGLDSTYDSYAITGENLDPSVNSFPTLRFGDSGGIDSGSTDYTNHLIIQESGGSSYNAVSSSNASSMTLMAGNSPSIISFQAFLHGVGSGFEPSIHGKCIYGYKSTLFTGWRKAAITLDRVQFFFLSGNVTSGRFTVWGISHE